MDINKVVTDLLSILRKNDILYDKDLYKHSYRVLRKTKNIIEQKRDIIEDEEIPSIIIGAFLHDLGKTLTPKEILYKPSTLTKEEFEIIKEHPKNGLLIFQNKNLFKQIREVLDVSIELYENIIQDIILYHHEKLDGKGYYGYINNDIIVNIISVADVYSALTEPRVYKKSWNRSKALSVLKNLELQVAIIECAITTMEE